MDLTKFSTRCPFQEEEDAVRQCPQLIVNSEHGSRVTGFASMLLSRHELIQVTGRFSCITIPTPMYIIIIIDSMNVY